MRVKTGLSLIVVLFTGLLSGCAGVSQEEYDLIQSQLEEREAEIAGLQAQASEYEAEIAELQGQLDIYQAAMPSYTPPAERAVTDCVEPTNPMVRDKAVSLVADTPSGIKANSEAWKIWQINFWVANNISYVSDPSGHEHYSYAHETLEAKGGDCDDIAILLASLYESVGLDAVVAHVNTDNDGQADHMACLVYYSEDADSFLDEEQTIMSKLLLRSPTGKLEISSFPCMVPIFPLKGYTEGIWIIADPITSDVRDIVGYVTYEPYELTRVVDVGN